MSHATSPLYLVGVLSQSGKAAQCKPVVLTWWGLMTCDRHVQQVNWNLETENDSEKSTSRCLSANVMLIHQLIVDGFMIKTKITDRITADKKKFISNLEWMNHIAKVFFMILGSFQGRRCSEDSSGLRSCRNPSCKANICATVGNEILSFRWESFLLTRKARKASKLIQPSSESLSMIHSRCE